MDFIDEVCMNYDVGGLWWNHDWCEILVKNWACGFGMSSVGIDETDGSWWEF